MVGAKPTSLIDKIHEIPEFSTLWHLQRQIVRRLRKVGNIKSPLDGHSVYILSKEASTLFSSKDWKDPKEFGKYYKIPVTAITETKQIT